MSQFSTTAALEVCIGEEEAQGGKSEREEKKNRKRKGVRGGE